MLPRKPALSIQPDDILEGHQPCVQRLANELRILVKKTIPDAVEKAYPHWHGIGYNHPEVGYFCAIFPHDELVKLGFEFGVLLPDPHSLLEGSGKQVRYATIRNLRQIRRQAIRKLLKDAVSLPEKREARLSLIRGMQRANKEII